MRRPTQENKLHSHGTKHVNACICARIGQKHHFFLSFCYFSSWLFRTQTDRGNNYNNIFEKRFPILFYWFRHLYLSRTICNRCLVTSTEFTDYSKSIFHAHTVVASTFLSAKLLQNWKGFWHAISHSARYQNQSNEEKWMKKSLEKTLVEITCEILPFHWTRKSNFHRFARDSFVPVNETYDALRWQFRKSNSKCVCTFTRKKSWKSFSCDEKNEMKSESSHRGRCVSLVIWNFEFPRAKMIKVRGTQ